MKCEKVFKKYMDFILRPTLFFLVMCTSLWGYIHVSVDAHIREAS